MKKILLILATSLALTSAAIAQEPTNKYCPVTPTDLAEPDISTEYEGRTIYFCCKSCLRDFIKEPQVYLANLDPVPTMEDTHGSLDHSDSQPENEGDDHSHGEIEEHDHSEHGDGSSPFYVFLGKFHVIAIHFPIALLPFAALAEIVCRITRKNTWGEIATISFQFGTLSAATAAIMGWIAASTSNYPDSLSHILLYHRWLGVTVASLSIFSSVILFWLPSPILRNVNARTTIIIATSILVLTTAHFGGSLIYGPDYLF